MEKQTDPLPLTDQVSVIKFPNLFEAFIFFEIQDNSKNSY